MGDLDSLTVIELKKLLREQGLAVSGNKSELILRLSASEEEFLVLEDEEITSKPIKQIPTQTIVGKPVEKIETYCRSCRSGLRYPSGYSGMLTCPKCKYQFEIKPAFGLSQIYGYSFAILVLTIIVALIVAFSNDGSEAGEYGSGLAAGAICMGGLTLSGALLVLALMFSLTKKTL